MKYLLAGLGFGLIIDAAFWGLPAFIAGMILLGLAAYIAEGHHEQAQ